MTKKKYYYKVLFNMRSVNGEEKLTFKYKVGKWIKPKIKGTKLFVFGTIRDARSVYYGDKIFKCVVKNPEVGKTIVDVNYLYSKSRAYLRSFFKGEELEDYHIDNAPFGTYVCDEVKLLKEVKK